jgi:hypothetical protein
MSYTRFKPECSSSGRRLYIQLWCGTFYMHQYKQSSDGFGGLVVSMLASGSRVRGFEPNRSRWIFSDVKKSSVCLPSEGK